MSDRIPNWKTPTIEELEATVKCLYCMYDIDPEWVISKENHDSPKGFFIYQLGGYKQVRVLTDRDRQGLQLIFDIQVKIHEEKIRRASESLKTWESKLKQESTDMEMFMKDGHFRYGV
jgi:hypothetical protein